MIARDAKGFRSNRRPAEACFRFIFLPEISATPAFRRNKMRHKFWLSILRFWLYIEQTKVDKFIKKEIESANDTTEKNALETEQSVVRGGQLFTDQFYSQHMRFHKDVSFILLPIQRCKHICNVVLGWTRFRCKRPISNSDRWMENVW